MCALKALYDGVMYYLPWGLVPPGRNPGNALFIQRGIALEKVTETLYKGL